MQSLNNRQEKKCAAQRECDPRWKNKTKKKQEKQLLPDNFDKTTANNSFADKKMEE